MSDELPDRGRVARWVKEATTPRPDEIAAVVEPLDPGLRKVSHDATAPTSGEVTTLLARLPRPGRQRANSPLWIGVPLLLALFLLTVRWVLPSAALRDTPTDHEGLQLVIAALPTEIVPGVSVDGRGEATVRDGRVVLDGILRVLVSAPAVLEVGGNAFSTRDAELHVAGDTVAVVRGSVQGPDGRFLVSGDRWSPAVVAVAPEPPASPAPPPVARVVHPPKPPRVRVEEPVVVAEAEPPGPDAVTAWRDLLAAHEGGLADGAFVHRIERYRRAWPNGPFDAEAADLSALERAGFSSAAEALPVLEERLAVRPNGPWTRELHAEAAFLAREELKDCDRARPHDGWLAAHTVARTQATAQAFLGLCALRQGHEAEGRAQLASVKKQWLDASLQAAVGRAESGHEESP